MRSLVALATLGLALAACGGAQKHTENLLEQSTRFQEGLRWGRYEDAAAQVPPADREAFLDEHDELSEELRIDDYEVIRVHVKKDHDEAMVQVKYTWHLDSEGIVNETVTDQLWERRGTNWWMKEELHKRGDDMPGVARKAKRKRGGSPDGSPDGSPNGSPKKAKESAPPGDPGAPPDAVPGAGGPGEESADPASEAAQSGKASGDAPL